MEIVYPLTTRKAIILDSIVNFLKPRYSEILAAFGGGYIYALRTLPSQVTDGTQFHLPSFRLQMAALLVTWGFFGIYFSSVSLIDTKQHPYEIKPRVKISGIELPRFMFYVLMILFSVFLFKY